MKFKLNFKSDLKLRNTMWMQPLLWYDALQVTSYVFCVYMFDY